MRHVVFIVLAATVLTPRTSQAQLTAEPLVRFIIPEADGLGVSVAVYADTVLLGTNGPEAYVFQYDGANWWMQRFSVPGTSESDWFDVVAIDRDVALIGVSHSPHVYVFRSNGTTWDYEATLSDDQNRDGFGSSVDVQGDLAVVAVPSSEAQVFRFDGLNWIREARFSPENLEGGRARYGFAEQVVLDDERVLVSKDSRIGDEFEGIYSFRFDGATWRHEDTFSLGETETVFQGEIALDGEIALIDEDYGNVVHVFRFDGLDWKREAILEPPDLGGPTCSCLPIPGPDRERCSEEGGDTPNFGVSIAIDGDLAIVGANLDDGVGIDSGAVYVFRHDGKRWDYEMKFYGEPTPFCGAGFGRAVALHGTSVLARSDAYGEGVYLFRLR
jgi:hypothetical protein